MRSRGCRCSKRRWRYFSDRRICIEGYRKQLSKDMEQFEEITKTPPDGVCCMYVLQCRDGSLYTGWTNHLQERVKAHNLGRGAKYTKGRGPVKCVYVETFASKEEAMSREFEVKHLDRARKEEMIRSSLRSHI